MAIIDGSWSSSYGFRTRWEPRKPTMSPLCRASSISRTFAGADNYLNPQTVNVHAGSGDHLDRPKTYLGLTFIKVGVVRRTSRRVV